MTPGEAGPGPTAPLRAATRASPLARWQTDHVAERLAASPAGPVRVEAVPVSTEGDRRLGVDLAVLGGKGVFVKEVQAAVLEGRADIAVHSAKDLPAVTPPGLVIAAALAGADPRDALVGGTLSELAHGATVATGSARRRVQLLARRPDLQVVGLRGNMATRLARVGEVAAVVAAAAALDRLGWSDRIDERLEPSVMLPQVGQGVIVVECRADDADTLALLSALEDPPTRRRLEAERAFLAELGGDCSLPAAAHATVGPTTVQITALLAVDDEIRRITLEGEDPEAIGRHAARRLGHGSAA